MISSITWALVSALPVLVETVPGLGSWSTSFGRSRGWTSDPSLIASSTEAVSSVRGEASTFRFPRLRGPCLQSDRNELKVSVVRRTVEVRTRFPKFWGRRDASASNVGPHLPL